MSRGSILEIDVGNTRLKWRRLDADGERQDGGAETARPLPDLAPLFRGAAGAEVRIGSVAGSEQDEALEAALRAAGSGAVRFARTSARHGRLGCGYTEPARLGVDRWLAIVAASERSAGAFAVIDAGSALTLDLVAADGAHLGGWIVPGIAMMRRALLSGTAGVRFADLEPEGAPAPGRDTLGAVAHGTVAMARDFVHRRVEAFRAEAGKVTVFVTGGDGDRLADELAGPVERVPELVLDGLGPLLAEADAAAGTAAS